MEIFAFDRRTWRRYRPPRIYYYDYITLLSRYVHTDARVQSQFLVMLRYAQVRFIRSRRIFAVKAHLFCTFTNPKILFDFSRNALGSKTHYFMGHWFPTRYSDCIS